MCLCDRKEKFTNFQMLCVNCRSSAVQFGSLNRSRWKEPELDQPSAKINSNKFHNNINCLYMWNALRAYIFLEWNFTHPSYTYLFAYFIYEINTGSSNQISMNCLFPWKSDQSTKSPKSLKCTKQLIYCLFWGWVYEKIKNTNAYS